MLVRSLAAAALATAIQATSCGDAAAFTSSIAVSKDRTHAFVTPGGPKMSPYNAAIHRLIFDEIKRTALPFGIASNFTFVVRFDLDRQGRLAGLGLLQGSNLAEANEYALLIIRRASRGFPPMPAEVPGERIHFVIPIRMIGE